MAATSSVRANTDSPLPQHASEYQALNYSEKYQRNAAKTVGEQGKCFFNDNYGDSMNAKNDHK